MNACSVCGTPIGRSRYPVCLVHAAAPEIIYVRRQRIVVPDPPTERERKLLELFPVVR